MGLLMGEVTFHGPAPDLDRIVEKMAEISGLQVSVREEDAAIKDELRDISAKLVFTCAPDEYIEVYTYRPGGVKQSCDEMFEGQPDPFLGLVEGYHVTDESQVVYWKTYVGAEPTLCVVTDLALEALGGRCPEPTPEDLRRQFGGPVTPAELQRRRRKARRGLRMGCALQVLLLPITIPLCLLSFLWFVVAMPWRIWRAYKLCRDRGWLTSDSDQGG